MSAVILNEVRKGFYLDSVALMRLSREIAGMEGVEDAALMMASPSNLAILRDAGLVENEPSARPNDLMLALRARDRNAGEAALAAARAALERPKAPGGGGGQKHRPRSIAAAVREAPQVNLALISVPGAFAAAEGRKALRRGLNVLMFSDNVSIEDELALKREARDLGLLMMGPDCGTAILGGAPMAFANRVERGSIGIVGASGTGMQEVSSLISEAGGGISHAIGVGGRDLKQEIGAITTLMAIDALDADTGTESVVLISKPPHPEVAARVLERVAASAKSFTICFIGADRMALPPNARQAMTLCEAAELALGGKRIEAGITELPKPRAGRIEGLFAGGTLAAEAQMILAAAGRDVMSNAPIPGIAPLGNATADRILDLGADEYTQGRPHPMIDPSVRDDELRGVMADSGVAAVLVDLVIGYGAHADPATHLAEVIGERRGGPVMIGSVTGTRLDPQGLDRQIARLRQVGVVVAASNAHACRLALAAVAVEQEATDAPA